jgi:uncharacterized protein YjdB
VKRAFRCRTSSDWGYFPYIRTFKNNYSFGGRSMRKSMSFIACVAVIATLSFALVSCGDSDGSGDSPISVTGVKLSKATTSIEVLKTEQLTATIAPANASNKNVTWSSNNESVATVSAKGLVSALAAGTANITVKTEDGSFTAVCAVTVTAAIIAVPGPVGAVTYDSTLYATTTVGSSSRIIKCESSVGYEIWYKYYVLATDTSTVYDNGASGTTVSTTALTIPTSYSSLTAVNNWYKAAGTHSLATVSSTLYFAHRGGTIGTLAALTYNSVSYSIKPRTFAIGALTLAQYTEISNVATATGGTSTSTIDSSAILTFSRSITPGTWLWNDVSATGDKTENIAPLSGGSHYLVLAFVSVGSDGSHSTPIKLGGSSVVPK